MTATDPGALFAAFRERYGRPDPTALVRAPGRVNLIGEHIDYNGLSVLPMAIPRHVALLLRPRTDTTVRIASAAEFGQREFTIAESIPSYPVGDWGNYVKAAVQELERTSGPLAGFDAVLGSSVPVASGLSSSSALVIAVALATLHANDLTEDPLVLAERMAHAERYTGTQGGGMDQAICLGAKAGMASRVDFHPLKLTPFPVPPDWRIVIADSLTRAEKSGGAQQRYNERTRECAAALAAVTAHLGLPGIGYRELLAARPVADLLATGATVLADPVGRRFRHVVTEADRVSRCERALTEGDLAALGRALTESHASLRDDYEVSTPVLDTLCALAERGGAAGARLTGAGMGGCVLAACAAERADAVLQTLAEGFYASRLREGPLAQHLFVAEPAQGARVEGVRSAW